METYSDHQPLPVSTYESPGSSPNAPLTQHAVQLSSRLQRTWPAVLTLYFLAPFIAEMLTGSTPPWMWNNVGGVILTTGLYGSGALLARELVRRRGLGWDNLALLGVAYGVLEEGMAMQSWFNPTWTNPPDRLRFFELNWTLALALTTIHMVLSIMSSIVIAEALFTRLVKRPWPGQKGVVGFTLWLGMVTSWLFFTYGFVVFHGKGYDHPPFTYGIALLLFVLFLWLGLHRYRVTVPAVTEPNPTVRPAPRLWILRLMAFAATFAVLLNLLRWSKRSGWGACHRLALASGVIGFFIFCSPLFEFVLPKKPGLNMTGLTLVNLLALGGLIWLGLRTAHWEHHRPEDRCGRTKICPQEVMHQSCTP